MPSADGTRRGGRGTVAGMRVRWASVTTYTGERREFTSVDLEVSGGELVFRRGPFEVARYEQRRVLHYSVDPDTAGD